VHADLEETLEHPVMTRRTVETAQSYKHGGAYLKGAEAMLALALHTITRDRGMKAEIKALLKTTRLALQHITNEGDAAHQREENKKAREALQAMVDKRVADMGHFKSPEVQAMRAALMTIADQRNRTAHLHRIGGIHDRTGWSLVKHGFCTTFMTGKGNQPGGSRMISLTQKGKDALGVT
jgi:hypothetical protein